MLQWLRQRARHKRNAQNLYGSIVAQARDQRFYADWGVPDTVSGRFELLTLHMFLWLERLRGEGAEGARLAQELVDAFFADMDASNREMGVGDMAVPKKMRRLAAAFQERMKAYETAVADGRGKALADLIAESLFDETPQPRNAARIAAYVQGMRAALQKQSLGEIASASRVKAAPS